MKTLALTLAAGASISLATLAAAAATGEMGPAPSNDTPHMQPADPVSTPASVNHDEPAPVIDVAILLDTSSSMDGLIDQARDRLWSIVNDLATSKKNGQYPDIRVALYHYGNSRLAAETGYIEQLQPLTDDLDAVSESLYALTTSGGDEYCGQVIQVALEQLEWSAGDHYRAIFIAGNEPFTQGSIDAESACRSAIAKGIVVNTIHCGDHQAAINGGWVSGAKLADGECISIDQNSRLADIAAPQDSRISELNQQLNATYVAYGAHGRDRHQRQVAQDSNAVGSSAGSFAERAAAKASSNYSNADWDLVDAVAEGEVQLESLAPAALPPGMADLSPEEQLAVIEEKREERARIQSELTELTQQRRDYVAAKRAELGDADDGFGAAVSAAIDQQLEQRGFDRSAE